MKRSPRLAALRNTLLAVAMSLTLPLLVSNTSCTAIGYGIGTSITRNEPPRRVPAGTALHIPVGTPMEVAGEDGSPVRGVYLGRVRTEGRSYASHYDAWRSRTPGAPALGATVQWVDERGRARATTFAGFSFRALHVVDPATRRASDVPFTRVRTMRAGDGPDLVGSELAALDARGELPSLDALAVGQGLPFDWQKRWSPGAGISAGDLPPFRDTVSVPMDRVLSITVPSPRNRRTVCTFIGFAVDASVIAFATAMASYEGPFSGCDAGSINLISRVAPPPTRRDYDRQTGQYVDSSELAVAPPPAVADEPAGLEQDDAAVAMRRNQPATHPAPAVAPAAEAAVAPR